MQIKTKDLTGRALAYAVVSAWGGTLDANAVGSRDRTLLKDFPGNDGAVFFDDFDPEKDPYFFLQVLTEVGIDLRQIKRSDFSILDMRHYAPEKGDTIVEKYGRNMVKRPNAPHNLQGQWVAQVSNSTSSTVTWVKDRDFISPTPQLALFRCMVASRLGDAIDVPDEFLADAPQPEAEPEHVEDGPRL